MKLSAPYPVGGVKRPPRFDVVMAGFGTLALGAIVLWFLAAPELFLPLAAFMICALGLAVVGWLGVLIDPPEALQTSWMVIAFCMMDFSIRRGGVEAGSFDLQSVIKGGVWCVILAFGLLHGAKSLLNNRVLLVFGTYTAYAFLSSFYSRAMFLGLGAGVALLAISTYAGVVAGWDRDGIDKTWRRLYFALSAIALISMVLYFVLPDWAIDFRASGRGGGRLRGLTGSGNSFGPLMVVAIIIGLYYFRKAATTGSRLLVGFFLFVEVVALLLTDSRTSMVALGGAIVLVASLARPILFPFVGAALAGAFWVMKQPKLLQGVLEFVAGLVSRSGAVAEITSLTGRSEIWAAVFNLWRKSPWIGYGLGSPRVLISEQPISRWQTYESAHNWLLESLLSFGVLGTLFLVGFMVVLGVMLFKRFYRLRAEQPKSPDYLFSVCLLRCFVFALISGFSEKAFAGMPSASTILLGLMAGTAAALVQHDAAKRVLGGTEAPGPASPG